MGTVGVIVRTSAVLALASQIGCTGMSAGNSTTTASTANSTPYIQAQMTVNVKDSGGTTVYPTSGTTGTLMRAGVTYTLNLDVTNAPPGTTYSLQLTNIDQVNETPTTISLSAGANSFTVAAQGDYTLKLVASAPGYTAQTDSLTMSVACADPTFTVGSLNASAISVSSGATPNIYTYGNTASVIAGANGMAPYQCAWDPTGTGIVDSAFVDCSSNPTTSLYSNYVANRSVGLVVKDSCNQTYTINNTQDLTYTVPSMPGNNFIYGATSGATGNAVGDARIDTVNYLADNNSSNPIVSTQYGSGSFTIFAWQNYQMGAKVNFGMQIKLQGLVETTPLDATTGAGAVSTASASIASVEFVTDENGDQAPSETFTGNSTSCTYTCPSGNCAKVMPITGQPCSGGTSGDQNSLTVEVWGNYTCTTMTSAGGTVSETGSFDGAFDIADSCSGGGQGGGGVQPPGF